MARSLRPSRADDLGLRQALADRVLPLLVAAMVFLAALAAAGAMSASGLAAHWRGGTASMVTVTVPAPDAAAGDGVTRADAVAHLLAGTAGITGARRLTDAEIAGLLKPWLGADAAGLGLHLPALFELRVAAGGPGDGLEAALDRAAPGSLLQRNDVWLGRLAGLTRSLQACAALALAIVSFVAAAMVGLATRAGLAARRGAIETVHALGATDAQIAGRFARRIAWLVLPGAVAGTALAVPVLLSLVRLAAPLTAGAQEADIWAALPPPLWFLLAALPVVAALIGWITAQATVRAWLRLLP